MKNIKLSQNKYAIVDDEWFDYINQWKWYYSNNGYAKRNESGRQILMHRLILNSPSKTVTDHINGNRLDNRVSNLRICNDSQNQGNSSKKNTNTSGYKGVSFNKKSGKYTAQITVHKNRIHLGSFSSAIEAAFEYDKEASRRFGEYARTNF